MNILIWEDKISQINTDAFSQIEGSGMLLILQQTVEDRLSQKIENVSLDYSHT